MSTISPEGSRSIAARLADHGMEMVDAPVTGSTFKAETGELNMFVGATDANFMRAEPVLRAMGTPQRVGPQGSGSMVKILHNTIVGTSMVAIIESLAMASRAGFDLAWLRDVLMKGTCRSFLLEEWIPRTLLKGDFSKGFFSKHMAKDLGIALETARSLQVPAFATAASQQVYAQAANFGIEEEDITRIIKLYLGGD
jgi:3-hydroxyisobutyrate dehydrogenase-like beta-hydroxyacid dehydrogenase